MLCQRVRGVCVYCILKCTPVTAAPCSPLQVQNASDLLIKPLEKFRKEQIGVTKVSVFAPSPLLRKWSVAHSCEVGCVSALGALITALFLCPESQIVVQENTFLSCLHWPNRMLKAASSNHVYMYLWDVYLGKNIQLFSWMGNLSRSLEQLTFFELTPCVLLHQYFISPFKVIRKL